MIGSHVEFGCIHIKPPWASSSSRSKNSKIYLESYWQHQGEHSLNHRNPRYTLSFCWECCTRLWSFDRSWSNFEATGWARFWMTWRREGGRSRSGLGEWFYLVLQLEFRAGGRKNGWNSTRKGREIERTYAGIRLNPKLFSSFGIEHIIDLFLLTLVYSSSFVHERQEKCFCGVWARIMLVC